MNSDNQLTCYRFITVLDLSANKDSPVTLPWRPVWTTTPTPFTAEDRLTREGRPSPMIGVRMSQTPKFLNKVVVVSNVVSGP